MTADDFLYLSEADVAAVGLNPAVAREAIVDAFVAHHRAEALSKPKLGVALGPGHGFQSMCAVWREKGLAVNKWLGIGNPPPGSGLPNIHATVTLNAYDTGQLLAVMDGNLLTGIRTAAMSCAAAQFLARKDSRSIGFIGCGLQARSHLPAMKALLPDLSTVRAFSRTRGSAEAFAAAARRDGFEAAVFDSPREVVEASDVIVSTVPMTENFEPFLDPDWIAPGGFAAAVDIGRSWLPQTLRALDILAVDDHAQQADSPPISSQLGPIGSFDADLSELAAQARPGRVGDRQRTMFIFRGFALADLAIAAKIYEAACLMGVGQRLKR